MQQTQHERLARLTSQGRVNQVRSGAAGRGGSTRRRRSRASRSVATGISTSGFVGMIVAMSAAPPPWSQDAPSTPIELATVVAAAGPTAPTDPTPTVPGPLAFTDPIDAGPNTVRAGGLGPRVNRPVTVTVPLDLPVVPGPTEPPVAGSMPGRPPTSAPGPTPSTPTSSAPTPTQPGPGGSAPPVESPATTVAPAPAAPAETAPPATAPPTTAPPPPTAPPTTAAPATTIPTTTLPECVGSSC